MEKYVYTIQRGQDREMNETFNLVVATLENYNLGNGIHAEDETFYSMAGLRDFLDEHYNEAEEV